MTDRLYLRHSTDKQTNARQLHALDSLLKSGAPMYEDPATSSRVYAVDRAGFRRLLDEAAVGDTIRVADAARLFRSTKDVIQIREVLQRRGLHLHIATGAWSGFDLAAEDPQTKLFVTMLAGVLEFQRDMISENTKEGVAAAAASGKALGRPAALTADQAGKTVEAYRTGATVKGLARKHGVSPKTIRRALDAAGARDLPELLGDAVGPEPALRMPEAGRSMVLDVPGLLAEHLQSSGDTTVREALSGGRTVRRGQGYSVRVTAPLASHQAALQQCAALTGDGSTPAGRKAYRAYADRIAGATQAS